ncbi:MAG: hypothetical protein ACI4C1_01485 [Lachnospiraceae bacterium]
MAQFSLKRQMELWTFDKKKLHKSVLQIQKSISEVNHTLENNPLKKGNDKSSQEKQTKTQ